MALFIRVPSIRRIGILQPQQRGVDHHEHGAAVVPQRAVMGFRSPNAESTTALRLMTREAMMLTAQISVSSGSFSSQRFSMFSSLTSAQSERIINALPNIMFVIIIDLNRRVHNNQKSGFIRYGTNQMKLFGEDAWIAGRGKADRLFSGPLRSC